MICKAVLPASLPYRQKLRRCRPCPPRFYRSQVNAAEYKIQ